MNSVRDIENLIQQNCTDLQSELALLGTDEASHLLDLLDPEWQFIEKDSSITNTYEFKNYYQTMAFANVIAQIAHQQDHHPDLHITYNRCTVSYTTHSVGGLSVKDFICAAKINAALSL